MPDFGELFDKAKELASEHPDQVHEGIEKAEELAEKQLGSGHEHQIEQGGEMIEKFLGGHNLRAGGLVGRHGQ
jgi:hypothetical protein